MSYTKIQLEVPMLADALAAVAPSDCQLTKQSELLASGIVVELDTGDKVWVACVMQDNPETTPVEFVAVAIAVTADGPVLRPSGLPVHVAFMHPVSPDLVAEYGAPSIRRDLMLVALGEQPVGEIAPPSAERNIRSGLAVLQQMLATPEDVL